MKTWHVCLIGAVCFLAGCLTGDELRHGATVRGNYLISKPSPDDGPSTLQWTRGRLETIEQDYIDAGKPLPQ